MEQQEPRRAQLINEAADWFARLQDPAATAADREAFDAWLMRSPAHIEAHLKVSRTWGDLGMAVDAAPSIEDLINAAAAENDPPNIVSLPSPSPAKRGRVGEGATLSNPRSRFTYAAAASIAAVLATSAAWLLHDRWFAPTHLQTAVGEQRSVTLPDGSIVYLNTNSDARIGFNEHERRITLASGEARFTVAKDSRRPFLVITHQATVRAIGTVFNVQANGTGTAVTVIEGRVAVSSSIPSPASGGGSGRGQSLLSAGQRAAITNKGGLHSNTGPTVEKVIAWTQRQLVFRDDTLADVLSEFNRYHADPILIEDPQLATLKINGVFDARDSDSLLEYLQHYRHMRIETTAGGQRVLVPASN